MTERRSIDIDLINAFVGSAQTVLHTQANTKLVPGKPRLKEKNEQLQTDIAGIISLNCDQFKGSITLAFPTAVFLKIYENMVGETHTEINDDMQDAAGEILNIVFGQVKTMLNDQKGYNLQKAIPTVLAGEGLKVRQMTNQPALILPFKTEAGDFFIVVAVDMM